MKIEKKVIANLTKCYSIAPLKYNDRNHFLVAAEKYDPCYLFDMNGTIEETVWTEPGGVMCMVQVPSSNGQFLAVHRFYSPNDSKEAKIVIATPKEKNDWEIRTLVDLPFVHRFDILTRNNVNYLIACALKSGHNSKDDWSMPGKVFFAVLPTDLHDFNENHQLKLEVIKDGLLKNHGYYRVVENGIPTSIISSDNGVFQFTPPASVNESWQITPLISDPASDAVLVDLDQDGESELAVLSPFHGKYFSIYKKQNGKFKKVYEYAHPLEFLHALYGGMLCGKPVIIVGHREGNRDLLIFRYNSELETYEVERVDHDCGPANILHLIDNGEDVLISTNREINEVTMYHFREE